MLLNNSFLLFIYVKVAVYIIFLGKLKTWEKIAMEVEWEREEEWKRKKDKCFLVCALLSICKYVAAWIAEVKSRKDGVKTGKKRKERHERRRERKRYSIESVLAIFIHLQRSGADPNNNISESYIIQEEIWTKEEREEGKATGKQGK